MGNNKFTLKYLTGNKKLVAIASVIIAFVVWLTVVINQTPTIEKTISLPIKDVRKENLPMSRTKHKK